MSRVARPLKWIRALMNELDEWARLLQLIKENSKAENGDERASVCEKKKP